MSLISTILDQLETPDDQGRDWYGWASNQLSHAVLGLLYAGAVQLWLHSVGIGAAVAMTIALVKEFFDIRRVPTWRTAQDSLQDVLFQGIGAALASALYLRSSAIFILAAFFIAAALIIGIIPRARKAINA